ncbi:hypothetical protein DAA51_25195 [Bradyrhizobium sp. WBAH10]|nr:hypothetical protein [Bradyrhizobium sp. WBAH30]MDD1543080.1 hypothetical protein [Bradyrhizobium sp. WBAH41]MDD1554998.1 hypothetical protein [Bradyrhizobium sp. WBAH23]MDD1562949.1 hypothetical protein [Bradyrhizobium sp. WBAH33]MDD1591050.1 hypothetical protein [Bradyrhizobium sp. WBAH42]NRB86008.1 hypothetical protein [Bradyrhizobium sp. WBAH10]QCJ91458.1 hypothetical protein DAA57_25445 [Bradyrhizobium yuanmingense]
MRFGDCEWKVVTSVFSGVNRRREIRLMGVSQGGLECGRCGIRQPVVLTPDALLAITTEPATAEVAFMPQGKLCP